MSDHLRAFFGFFEKDFRIFDFYQGMDDARRDLVKSTGQDPDAPSKGPNFKRPEDAIEEGWSRAFWKTPARRKKLQAWAPFLGMRAHNDRVPKWQSACKGDELHNFRILLQTSLGKPIVKLLRYIPTERLVYLTFGRAVELGISSAHPRASCVPSWLRRNFGLQVQGLHTLFSSLPDVVAFTPALGRVWSLVMVIY